MAPIKQAAHKSADEKAPLMSIAPLMLHCFRSRTTTLSKIHHYQKSKELLIPWLAFHCFGRKIIQDLKEKQHFQIAAIDTLHVASEAYLIGLFEDINMSVIHAKPDIIIGKDIKFRYRIRSERLKPLAHMTI